jgi:hypothetical protein
VQDAVEKGRETADNDRGVRMTYYLVAMLQLPVDSVVVGLLLGSALLALWTLARFERFRPRTLGGSLLAGGAGLMSITALGTVVEGIAATGIPDARMVIAIVIVVPVCTYFFLSSGWVMRAVLDLFGGFG